MDNQPDTLNKIRSINLKLSSKTGDDFKEAARQNRTSMQQLLHTFVNSYIKNPGRFNIEMEFSNEQL